MIEEQERIDRSKTEKEISKKSQKDLNGMIGSLVCSLFLAFVTYQMHITDKERN